MMPDSPYFAEEMQRLYGMRIQITKEYSKCAPLHALSGLEDGGRPL